MCIYGRAPEDMVLSERLKGQSESASSHLPNDVIERIFALLPLKEKLACRSVCRSWNSILSTDCLLTYTSNTSSSTRGSGYGNACFMLTTKGPLAYALDPLANIWFKFHQPACPGASVLAAVDGLVCVGNQVSECRSLIIFSLFSSTWKLLPNMLRVGLLHKVTMARDPLSHSYVVVVTGEDTSKFRGRRAYRLLTEVYDSISGSWRMAGDAMPEAKFGSDPGVWHNGIFYCVTELPYGVTAFDLAKGRWMELRVEMPRGISHPSLVSCKEQLMMVGIQEHNSHCEQVVHNSNFDSTGLPMSEGLPPRFTRSWSWSGPLQMLVSSQLRSTLFAAWPAVNLPPKSSLAAAAPLLSSLLSVHSSPSSPTRSATTSPPRPEPKKPIRVWSLMKGKQWMAIGEMPEDDCAEFLAYLMPRTPLVCAGVGDEICITSHLSPQTVVLDLKGMHWRHTASDPLFPSNRDAHLLGFTVQPNASCVP